MSTCHVSPSLSARRRSCVCTLQELYPAGQGLTPAPEGVLDLRLGTSKKDAVCRTCGEKLMECTGHFGYVRLCLPVFHTGYFKHVLNILQCICKHCSRLLLPPEERTAMLAKVRQPNIDVFRRRALYHQVIDKCRKQCMKKVSLCPYCGEVAGAVKKVKASYLQARYPPPISGMLPSFLPRVRACLRRVERTLGANLALAVHSAHGARVNTHGALRAFLRAFLPRHFFV